MEVVLHFPQEVCFGFKLPADSLNCHKFYAENVADGGGVNKPNDEDKVLIYN